jgi:hypothetical protein
VPQVTALTIGYGDVFAITYWGRGVAMLAGLCGTALFAILVSVFSNASHFAADERRAFEAMANARRVRVLRQEAGRLVCAALRYHRHTRTKRAAAAAQAKAAAGAPPLSASASARGLVTHAGKRVRTFRRMISCTTERQRFLRAMRQWRTALETARDGARETSDNALLSREILELQSRLSGLSDSVATRNTAAATGQAALAAAVGELATYMGTIGAAVGAGPLPSTPALAALRAAATAAATAARPAGAAARTPAPRVIKESGGSSELRGAQLRSMRAVLTGTGVVSLSAVELATAPGTRSRRGSSDGDAAATVAAAMAVQVATGAAVTAAGAGLRDPPPAVSGEEVMVSMENPMRQPARAPAGSSGESKQ